MSNDMTIPDAWPMAGLDPIARLRVLATGLPGVVVVDAVFDVPFEQLWPLVTDFERSVPASDVDVARLRIVERRGDPATGERLRFRTRQTARVLWMPGIVDVELSPGWCWMVSRPQAYVIGMAAEPEGDRTRFAMLEGVALQAPRWLRPLVQPALAASRWRHRRHLPHDVAGFARFVEQELRG